MASFDHFFYNNNSNNTNPTTSDISNHNNNMMLLQLRDSSIDMNLNSYSQYINYYDLSQLQWILL